jgi:hypothetical protein
MIDVPSISLETFAERLVIYVDDCIKGLHVTNKEIINQQSNPA